MSDDVTLAEFTGFSLAAGSQVDKNGQNSL